MITVLYLLVGWRTLGPMMAAAGPAPAPATAAPFEFTKCYCEFPLTCEYDPDLCISGGLGCNFNGVPLCRLCGEPSYPACNGAPTPIPTLATPSPTIAPTTSSPTRNPTITRNPTMTPTAFPTTSPTACICRNDCLSASNGVCDDGGPGSINSICALGWDCADCGSTLRSELDPGIDCSGQFVQFNPPTPSPTGNPTAEEAKITNEGLTGFEIAFIIGGIVVGGLISAFYLTAFCNLSCNIVISKIQKRRERRRKHHEDEKVLVETNQKREQERPKGSSVGTAFDSKHVEGSSLAADVPHLEINHNSFFDTTV